MKYILLLIMLFPIFSFGQKKLDNWVEKEMQKPDFDTEQFQQDYTNYCFKQFRKQQLIGISTQVVGAGLMIFYNIDDWNGYTDAYRKWELTSQVGSGSGSTFEYLVNLRKLEREYIDIEERNNTMTKVGAVVFLTGSIVHILSYRWLKKSRIQPAETGMGLMVKF